MGLGTPRGVGIMGKKSREKRDRRSIKMDGETAEALKEQLRRFKEKFGRDPAPEEPIFFDPDHPTPRPLQVEPTEAMVAQMMRKAGLRPELIYAFEKTGRLVTESNLDVLSEEELKEWEGAIDEYFRKHPTPEA